jgi:site-specific recombinase XerD
MLIYSVGLRVSEIVKLKLEDVDTMRKLIRIKGRKGKGGRYTIMSGIALNTLNEYMRKYKSQKWLFPGAKPENHITTRTVQAIFEQACEKANIWKEVGVHSLRHSFATHLLESGVELRYIQKLRERKSSKTTEISTHVSNTDIRNIKSHLDRLFENREEGSAKRRIGEHFGEKKVSARGM